VTECQGCGAWNNTSRTLCVLCGTPLAETDEWDAAAELPPLPPLPDGGLRASMPTWLREPPTPAAAEPLPLAGVIAPAGIEDPVPLGARADPRTFLNDDDFPQWLRDLAARREDVAGRSTGSDDTLPAVSTEIQHAAPAAWPAWPDSAGPTRAPASVDAISSTAAPVGAQLRAEPNTGAEPASTPEPEPGPDGRPPAAVVAARTLEESRGRDVWQTLLLVFLLIGIIVAALWALVSNGVFSPGV
jgi:hypothetical protein